MVLSSHRHVSVRPGRFRGDPPGGTLPYIYISTAIELLDDEPFYLKPYILFIPSYQRLGKLLKMKYSLPRFKFVVSVCMLLVPFGVNANTKIGNWFALNDMATNNGLEIAYASRP